LPRLFLFRLTVVFPPRLPLDRAVSLPPIFSLAFPSLFFSLAPSSFPSPPLESFLPQWSQVARIKNFPACPMSLFAKPFPDLFFTWSVSRSFFPPGFFLFPAHRPPDRIFPADPLSPGTCSFFSPSQQCWKLQDDFHSPFPFPWPLSYSVHWPPGATTGSIRKSLAAPAPPALGNQELICRRPPPQERLLDIRISFFFRPEMIRRISVLDCGNVDSTSLRFCVFLASVHDRAFRSYTVPFSSALSPPGLVRAALRQDVFSPNLHSPSPAHPFFFLELEILVFFFTRN